MSKPMPINGEPLRNNGVVADLATWPEDFKGVPANYVVGINVGNRSAIIVMST